MGAALRRGELPRNGEEDASWAGGLPDGGSGKGKGPEDASLVQEPLAGKQVSWWCLEPAVCRGLTQESARDPRGGPWLHADPLACCGGWRTPTSPLSSTPPRGLASLSSEMSG